MNFHAALSTTTVCHSLQPNAPLEFELWGRAECTLNRVVDSYRDQLVETGNDQRLGDFDRIAQLGIKAVRLPILWERVSPYNSEQRLWQWSDERIARMLKLGIRPIAEFLHSIPAQERSLRDLTV